MSVEKPTEYRIHSKFLPVGFMYEIIHGTLDMYNKDEDMSDSPLVQWGRRTLAEGGWWYDAQKAPIEEREAAIRRRQRKFLDLYEDIKNNGYNGSIISIFFDEDGNIMTYDGFHRLCIMKYLGMEEMLNCEISTRKTDFPLVETLMRMNSGKNIYQPCDDERLKRFNVWRKDSHKRLEFILENIGGSTVLDIGCSEGFFSRELSKRGFKVTALDMERVRVAITRYLATINNLELDYYCGRWKNYVKDKCFDNILYLSVFHHEVLGLGVEMAFKQLERFRGRTKKLFFEAPISSQKISWTPKNQKDLYDFTEEEFKTKIEEVTNMSVTKTWYGIRPIFLLEART